MGYKWSVTVNSTVTNQRNGTTMRAELHFGEEVDGADAFRSKIRDEQTFEETYESELVRLAETLIQEGQENLHDFDMTDVEVTGLAFEGREVIDTALFTARQLNPEGPVSFNRVKVGGSYKTAISDSTGTIARKEWNPFDRTVGFWREKYREATQGVDAPLPPRVTDSYLFMIESGDGETFEYYGDHTHETA